MTECPHCKGELRLPHRAWHNADAYAQSCLVVTECCNRAVTLTPVRRWSVGVYLGTKTEDDWGVPIASAQPTLTTGAR